jgi:hypothetical protein
MINIAPNDNKAPAMLITIASAFWVIAGELGSRIFKKAEAVKSRAATKNAATIW